MNIFKVILFCLIPIFLTGCGTTNTLKKQNKALSSALYGAQESIKKGRVDLAKSYIDQGVKLIPPPKKKVIIHEFKSSKLNTVGIMEDTKVDLGNNFIVLPPEMAARPVIIRDSKEYKDIVKNDKDLEKTEKINDKNINKLENQVDDIRREKEKIVEKAGSKSWFSRLTGWGFGLGIGGILLVVGIGIFFPAAIPLLFSIFGRIFSTVISLINSLIGWFSQRFKT